MTSSKGPTHVVVDGSNIATEGRSLPSLAQLNEAVMSFMEEYPDASVTVVVDATFGHRIDKKEVKEFEDGIANNELVAPPAGAVGRGDAFVLSIAQKANASILSNDSFQEFHGDYEWLFDEGRLIGGKPVPHVGWVFVDRVPVRGPVSRKATGGSRGGGRRASKSDTKESKRSGRKASAAAMEPMPVPTSPPPSRSKPAAESEPSSKGAKRSTPKGGEPVNDLMPFLEFVEHHPVGTSVNGTVESYSSHGAYITIGENGVRGYVPLRLMGDPAPTSARKVMKLGESVTLVVVSFAPSRRSIDCALPDMADQAIAAAAEDAAAETKGAEPAPDAAATGDAPAKKSGAKKRASADKSTPARKRSAKKPAAEKAAPKKRAPAKRTAAKKPAAKKRGARPADEQAAATTPPETTASAEKAPATKTTAKKAAAKKAASKKRAPAKKTAAKKTAAKKAPAKKTAAKKSAGKKKAPAKKAPAKRATSPDSSGPEGGA